jgi:hypothetical protein
MTILKRENWVKFYFRELFLKRWHDVIDTRIEKMLKVTVFISLYLFSNK